MGIIRRYFDYPVGTDESTMMDDICKEYKRDTHTHKDLPEDVCFDPSLMFDSRSDAVRYVEDTDGIPKHIAVQYMHPVKWEFIPESRQVETEACRRASEELDRSAAEIEAKSSVSFFADSPDEFITCPSCGSSFRLKEYLKSGIFKAKYQIYMSDYCPICGKTMLPDRELVARMDMNERNRKLWRAYESERKKTEQRVLEAEPYWLIKAEYPVSGVNVHVN